MAEKIGRLGYLGLAIEASSGSAEATPDVFIPFIENSIRGHHEALMDNSSRETRVKDFGSVSGKLWGEGDVTMYLDSINAGYLLKLALGLEARTQKNATPPVHDHLLTPTVSGNNATSATLWDYKGVDVERYAYACVDVCELEVTNDGIATIKASFMSQGPSSVSAPSKTTTSGTLYTWKDMNAKFGSTVNAARGATATKLTNFKLSIANNLEMNYKTGSQQPDTITYGPVEVTGSFTLFFENVTDRDAYYNLTKRSLIVTLAGANLGSGYAEQLEIVLKKIMLEDIEMETGSDDLFAITGNFRAEWDQAQAGYAEATLRNGKATDYT